MRASMPTLESGSSTFTSRSSTGKMVTFFHSYFIWASFSYALIGVLPPESAITAALRASIALSMMKPISPAIASANASACSCSHHSASIMPTHSVAFSQGNRRRRPPGSRRIGFRRHAIGLPAVADRVDPLPLRLDLVPADEEGRVAFDQVEQQPFVGDTAAYIGKGVGHADVQRNLAQAHAFAIETRHL